MSRPCLFPDVSLPARFCLFHCTLRAFHPTISICTRYVDVCVVETEWQLEGKYVEARGLAGMRPEKCVFVCVFLFERGGVHSGASAMFTDVLHQCAGDTVRLQVWSPHRHSSQRYPLTLLTT